MELTGSESHNHHRDPKNLLGLQGEPGKYIEEDSNCDLTCIESENYLDCGRALE